MLAKFTAVPLVVVSRQDIEYKDIHGTSDFNFNTNSLVEADLARMLGFDLIERNIAREDIAKIPRVFFMERCLDKVIVKKDMLTYTWHSDIKNKKELLARIDKLFKQDVVPYRQNYADNYSDMELLKAKEQLGKLFDKYVYHLFNKVYTGNAGRLMVSADEHTIQMTTEIAFLREWHELQPVYQDLYQAEQRLGIKQREEELKLCSAWKSLVCQLVFTTKELDGIPQGVAIKQENILTAEILQ